MGADMVVIADAWVLITGGMSGGDAPTSAFELIPILNMLDAESQFEDD